MTILYISNWKYEWILIIYIVVNNTNNVDKIAINFVPEEKDTTEK